VANLRSILQTCSIDLRVPFSFSSYNLKS